MSSLLSTVLLVGPGPQGIDYAAGADTSNPLFPLLILAALAYAGYCLYGWWGRTKIYRQMRVELCHLIDRIEGREFGVFDHASGLKERYPGPDDSEDGVLG